MIAELQPAIVQWAGLDQIVPLILMNALPPRVLTEVAVVMHLGILPVLVVKAGLVKYASRT